MEETVASQGLQIEKNVLYGMGSCTDTHLVIPKWVWKIASSFAESEGVERIERITFCPDVKEVEEGAFDRCAALKSLHLGAYEQVAFIDRVPHSFELILSDDLAAVGTFLFYSRAKKLENVHRVVVSEGTKVIAMAAFENFVGLEEIVLPESVTKIEQDAFRRCSKLKKINMPDALTDVTSSAFDWTPLIKEQEGGVTYVGNWVVGCDKKATEVTVREGTVGIACLAFYSCTALLHVHLPESLRYVCGGAFDRCYALQSLDFPRGLLHLNNMSMCSCNSLRRITLPRVGTKSIGKLFGVKNGQENDEYMPASLKTVVLTDQKDLPEDAFIWCQYVETFVLPDGLTSIGESAFMDCKSIKEIKLPDSVTEIGDRAFFGCKNLERVIWPAVRPKIGREAFWDTKIKLDE